MTKKALLFIYSQFEIQKTINKIKDRYLLTLEEFIKEFNTQELHYKLVNYEEITVIILLHANPKTKNKPYTFYKDGYITPEELLINIFSLNKQAKYNIIFLSCYGFYIHEFAYLLPVNSTLISFSDYLNNTIGYYNIVYYCNEPSSIISNYRLLQYYFKNSLTNDSSPIVFITTKNNMNKINITSLFHYIDFIYNVNPFYNMQKENFIHILDRNYIIDYHKKTYVDFLTVYDSFNEYSHALYKKIINEGYHNFNPHLYRNPYDIVKDLNLLFSNNVSLMSYFNNLFIRNIPNINIIFPPKYKAEILTYLNKCVEEENIIILK